VGVVREITGFYYRKRRRRLKVGSLSGGWSHLMLERKVGEDFILGHFYIIFNLEVGRIFMSLTVSNGLWTRGRI
jgi:hypothetical protein